MADQRASDADRERAAEVLRQAGGDGRLTVDELDERLGLVHEARTRVVLAGLLADVQEHPGELAAPTPGGAGVTVRRGPGGGSLVLSVMGGATRTGRWRVARRCTVVNVMGGSDVDLNDAEFADDVVEMTVVSIMGGGDVRVPEGLRVEVSDVGIMGGNDVERGRPELERADGPVLRLRLISIMGGTNVRRGRKRSRAERRAQRDALPPRPPDLLPPA